MRLILLSIALLLMLTDTFAEAPVEAALERANALGLYDEQTWRALLHFERGAQSSRVLSSSFFLSPSGSHNLQDEMMATIKAFYQPVEGDENDHPRCRFPARYLWLSSRLPLPGYEPPEKHCPRMKRWALLQDVQSISLLHVGGYLGNPASTFGHALLKLNTESEKDRKGFFDLTVSFGALVPPEEYILPYIFKGIFGGYQAGFTDRYYYSQDRVYTHTEFRDIWDYRLELSPTQKTMLILHIWEVIGHKFDYFFLDRNCAWRLAELIEIPLAENLTTTDFIWYLPSRLFQSLESIDDQRKRTGKPGVIRDVTFVPSSQRSLYARLQLLSNEEKNFFDKVLSSSPIDLPDKLKELNNFSADRQIEVIDSLLEYHQYRSTAEKQGLDSLREERNRQIMTSRLKLPPRAKSDVQIDTLPRPAAGAGPGAISSAFALDEGEKGYWRLGWSPFRQENVGLNNLEGDELVLLDLALGVGTVENESVFLDRLDLIRIINLKTLPVSLAEESTWSWEVRTGIERAPRALERDYEGAFFLGVGRAWSWDKRLLGYSMLDFELNTLEPVARLHPKLALRGDFDLWRSWLYWGMQSIDYSGDWRDVWGGRMQLQLSRDWAFRVETRNRGATQLEIGLVFSPRFP